MFVKLLLLLIIVVGVVYGFIRKNQAPKLDYTFQAPPPLSFVIQEISSVKEQEGDRKTWFFEYEKQNKKAQFKFEILLKPLKKVDEKGPAIAFTQGTFYHEKDSDTSIILPDLAKALDAKINSLYVNKEEKLPVTAAILGMSLSKDPSKLGIAGYFFENPSGNWMPIKLFVADGKGEFFLNINEQEKIGEISLKDSTYGDTVITELAKIL